MAHVTLFGGGAEVVKTGGVNVGSTVLSGLTRIICEVTLVPLHVVRPPVPMAKKWSFPASRTDATRPPGPTKSRGR